MKRYFAIMTALMAIFFSSCHKIDNPSEGDDIAKETKKINQYQRDELFGKYYYWRDDVKSKNSKVDASAYGIEEFFSKMMYEKDHWSWMCDKEYYVQSESGVYTGTWGFSYGQPYEYFDNTAIYVRYVFPGSPLEEFGVTRGAMLKEIGGKSVEAPLTQQKVDIFYEEQNKSPQQFTFTLANGKDTTFTASKAMTLSTRSSLISKVFTSEDVEGLQEPVGYFNYLTFNQNMTSDITDAMSLFKSAGVKKLIVDLRYNGGGSSVASDLLANCLAPASADGKIYVKRVHNTLLAKNDWDEETVIKRTDKSLDLDRIYFITGSGSASASEMVINGLRPLIDVVCVGDTTYGKPNGMYVFYYPGDKESTKKFNGGNYDGLKYVFLPICFYNKNGKDESIPDNGLIPTRYCPDDLFHDFTTEEANINACLAHIVTGSFPDLPSVQQPATKGRFDKGVRMAEEYTSDPFYGIYTVKTDKKLW